MDIKDDFYYILLKDTNLGAYHIYLVTKSAWDNSGVFDAPNFLLPYLLKFTLPGYTFATSGIHHIDYLSLDIIKRNDGNPVDGKQLLHDIKNYGYTINDEISEIMSEMSDSYFIRV